ncbi:MAG: hypothetical protein EVJ46_05770 [Candidatus Acididesulfobacter guangdongensis]|uniref:Putative restriction endonuclease domain-containing protein n=1 Tax=Acididesulfobacter guangdongensis TaxID=2597225 RepID=A0A519BGX8_ACIG2|nr:MAG: hypothetical protein EVJ46_05770 [Candidatus Acididesulfobacter guangdongensis]
MNNEIINGSSHEKHNLNDEETKISERLFKKFDEYFISRKNKNENTGLYFSANQNFDNFTLLLNNSNSDIKNLIKPLGAYFSFDKAAACSIGDIYESFLKQEQVVIECIPDIIIELSYMSDKNLFSARKKIYEELGIFEYWEINTEKKDIIVYRLNDDKLKFNSTYYPGDKVKTPILKGFGLSIHDVFNSRIPL